MSDTGDELFTEFEIDTFQEIMNIGFGQAAGDLSEIMNIVMGLGIPDLKAVKISDMIEYIKTEFKDFDNCSIIEQIYWGNSKGMALLVFPYDTGKEILLLFREDSDYSVQSDNIEELEKEVLIEIGNILIGACVGKIAELLSDTISYEPPRLISGSVFHEAFLKGMFDSDSWAILLKTVFQFEESDDSGASGYLFLVNSHDSIGYIRKALQDFLGQYE